MARGRSRSGKARSGTGKSLSTKSPTMGPRMTRKTVGYSNVFSGSIRQPNQPTGIQKLSVGLRFRRRSVKAISGQALYRSGGISIAPSISGGSPPKPVGMRIVGPRAPSGMRKV